MQGMSGGIWAPYKELASVINQAISKKQADAFYSLEAILKKHKTDFISLLKNPVCKLLYNIQAHNDQVPMFFISFIIHSMNRTVKIFSIELLCKYQTFFFMYMYY